jgi:isoleucyl-tRNA synthetase
VAELSEWSGTDQRSLDLHRPYVDDVALRCPTEGCGARATRLPPVLDAWFDSGAMPAAQFHHPFENRDVFERRFPADFICEAIDQTRGWFYSLLAVSTLVFDRSSYRNVVCLALLVDKQGQKMSKSWGNVVDPWDVIRRKGADALRWYLFSAGSPWTNRRFSDEGIDETVRKFLLTLWNTYSFFVMYANVNGWEPQPSDPGTSGADHVLDRWIVSRMHTRPAPSTRRLTPPCTGASRP